MKAYVVWERFEGYKQQLVFADTAFGASEKCRRGEIAECLEDDGPHPAGISSVRRYPEADTAMKGGTDAPASPSKD